MMKSQQMVAIVMARYFDGEFMDSGSAKENLEDLVKMVAMECAELCAKLDGGENIFSHSIRDEFDIKLNDFTNR